METAYASPDRSHSPSARCPRCGSMLDPRWVQQPFKPLSPDLVRVIKIVTGCLIVLGLINVALRFLPVIVALVGGR